MSKKQTIQLEPQQLGITERGGAAGQYPGVSRQLRRRLTEIDEQIAQLKAKKAKLLTAD